MNRHDRRSSIGMFQENVTALGANCPKAGAFEDANDFLALDGEGASYRDLLNSDQFERVADVVLALQAQLNRLAHSFHECVEGLGLGVTAPKGRDCSDVVAIFVSFNHNRERFLIPHRPPSASSLSPGISLARNWKLPLELLVEVARRAGNIDPARYAALAVLHALDDARRLAALGTIRALAGVHHLLTVRRFCDLCAYRHGSSLLISSVYGAAFRWISRADVVDGMFESSTRKALARKPGIHSGRLYSCVWFLFRTELFYSNVALPVLRTCWR